jgi:hypothetical protein
MKMMQIIRLFDFQKERERERKRSLLNVRGYTRERERNPCIEDHRRKEERVYRQKLT